MSATKVTPFPSPERQERILARMSLVKPIARQIHRKLRRGVEFEDLVHAGLVGLIDACDRRDPGRERSPVSFELYARYRIRGAIFDSLSEQLRRSDSKALGQEDSGPAVALSGACPSSLQACPTTLQIFELRIALESLPPNQRRVVELRLEGWTQKDIGLKLNIHRGTAGRLERKAIRALREKLGGAPPLKKAA